MSLNKKVTNRSANNSDFLQKSDVTEKQDKTQKGPTVRPSFQGSQGATSSGQFNNSKRKVSDLSEIERMYYDQLKKLLKSHSKESIRKSVENFDDKNSEITKKQLLAIFEMI